MNDYIFSIINLQIMANNVLLSINFIKCMKHLCKKTPIKNKTKSF